MREQGADRTPLVDLYVCDAWEGEAVECVIGTCESSRRATDMTDHARRTEEMAPVWTDLDKIPYAEMVRPVVCF